MKYAKLALGSTKDNVTSETVPDSTALSVIVDQGDVCVLVNNAVAATERFVEIHETLRGIRETLRESPVVQAWAGSPTQYSTASNLLGAPKDHLKIAIDVAQSTLVNAIAGPGTVAMVLPNTGGLSVRSRSALEKCVEFLGELDFDPPEDLLP
jgi:hypothetical protein